MKLFENLPDSIVKTDEIMKKHTSFKTGGNADYFISPESLEQLKYTIDICKSNSIPYYIIGNGSNLLVSDSGFRGVIIQICSNMSNFNVNGNIIEADAGIKLSKLSNIALENSLTGFEFASGIPGTLGGALCMNAGAYGSEMKQVVLNTLLMDESGNIFTLNRDELELSYRTSIIPQKNFIVLSSKINLKLGEYIDIKQTVENLTFKRKSKQPLEFPSAGSTFKRPEGYFAGSLIMDAGLKGFTIGGAQVSEKHCGFIINRHNATSTDIFRLIEHVQHTVKIKFGIDLEPEVKFIGQF